MEYKHSGSDLETAETAAVVVKVGSWMEIGIVGSTTEVVLVGNSIGVTKIVRGLQECFFIMVTRPIEIGMVSSAWVIAIPIRVRFTIA